MGLCVSPVLDNIIQKDFDSGKISFDQYQELKKLAVTADVDRDNKITKDEYNKYIAQYKISDASKSYIESFFAGRSKDCDHISVKNDSIGPKFYAACSGGINIGLARNLAENAARHVARVEKCGPESSAQVSGRVAGYLSTETVEMCESDPNTEACEFYGKFKELGSLPNNNRQYCALISVDPEDIICRIKKTEPPVKEVEEPAKPVEKKNEPAQPTSPTREQKIVLAKAVFEKVNGRLKELREGDDEKVMNKIFELINNGSTEEEAISKTNEYIDSLIDGYQTKELKSIQKEHKENEGLDPDEFHKKMQNKLE